MVLWGTRKIKKMFYYLEIIIKIFFLIGSIKSNAHWPLSSLQIIGFKQQHSDSQKLLYSQRRWIKPSFLSADPMVILPLIGLRLVLRSLCETDHLSRAIAQHKLKLTFNLKTENSTCKRFLLSLQSFAGPRIVLICLAPWGQTLRWQRLVNPGKLVSTFLAPFLTHWRQKRTQSTAAVVLRVIDMGIRKTRASFAPLQKQKVLIPPFECLLWRYLISSKKKWSNV